MGFFNVLGLISLIAVPAVIILHMLKRKQKDVHIPSTFLWERAADTSVQSKPWQKLKKSIPLILQIVAASDLASWGIKGIWNFSHVDLDLPKDVVVENVHLTDSLMTLLYKINEVSNETEQN